MKISLLSTVTIQQKTLDSIQIAMQEVFSLSVPDDSSLQENFSNLLKSPRSPLDPPTMSEVSCHQFLMQVTALLSPVLYTVRVTIPVHILTLFETSSSLRPWAMSSCPLCMPWVMRQHPTGFRTATETAFLQNASQTWTRWHILPSGGSR